MEIISLKVSEEKYQKIKKFYARKVIDVHGEYIDFVARINDVTITGYLSKHTYKKVTFAGDLASEESSLWIDDEYEPPVIKKAVKVHVKSKSDKKTLHKPVELKHHLKKIRIEKDEIKEEKQTKKFTKEMKPEPKPLAKATTTTKSISSGWVDLHDQIGSDEVGVGDFLAPIIVVASYVKKSDIKLLKDLKVNDSKKISDDKIRKIGPILAKNIEYSKLTLSNDRYNELIAKKENLNSIKAKMHNRALNNLYEKHPETVGVYVDQFVEPQKFYNYLNDGNEKIVRGIAFHTKGESIYPSVAVSSIIARYCLLMEMDRLNALYKTNFPLGAGSNVDEFSRLFIQKYGISTFNDLCKRNFANYKHAISVKLF